MFAEPERTRGDLSFRLFGFRVRVHPFFWLATLLFGQGLWNPDHPEFFLAWVAIAFVSFLVHELGHALAFRRFGVDAHIVLYALGGLAVPWDVVRGRWQRVAVSLAGPAAGFALAGLVWLTDRAWVWSETGRFAAIVYLNLLWINLVWGAVNLLPVIPLDGGRVSEELCAHFARRRGVRLAWQISMLTALAVVVYSLLDMAGPPAVREAFAALPRWFPGGTVWLTVLFGWLAYQSYEQLNRSRWTDSHWDR